MKNFDPPSSVAPSTLYLRGGKRCLDALVSGAGLIVLSPLLVLLAIAVKLSSPGPAIFRQARAGRLEKPFLIWKFRTMRVSNGGSLVTAADDSRITVVGKWLRKTKLDELPQLYNVLRGDMSLVGPRPEVPFYTARYTERQKEVFLVRPGITGPSIIMEEEELIAGQADKETYYLSTILPAKLETDLAYCQNIHFFNDLRLIFDAVTQIAFRKADRVGVSHRKSVGKNSGSLDHLVRPDS